MMRAGGCGCAVVGLCGWAVGRLGGWKLGFFCALLDSAFSFGKYTVRGLRGEAIFGTSV